MSEVKPDPHQDAYSKTVFGFWVYLMTDFMLFATLFAAYDVLHRKTFGGPTARELFYLPYMLAQAVVMLLAAFSAGLGGIFAHRRERKMTLLMFTLVLLFGAIFLWMTLAEFGCLMKEGNDWTKSAFLSVYYTLVGTHALHVLFALIWVPVLLIPVWREGVSEASLRRLVCLKIFWQFLNVVWIFIFSVVYLLGVH